MKTMKATSPKDRNAQGGSILLEALIGILIFSLGILGLMGLQAASIRNTTEAKYRSDAAFFSDKVIAEMWATTTDTTTRQALYGPGGASRTAWIAEVQAPGSGLPSIASTPQPSITFGAVPGAANDDLVTVTVTWQGPAEPIAHQYISTARINSKNY
jgi:type IV pilus assembly protein PilV